MFFLPVDHADLAVMGLHTLTHVQEQGAGTAGEIQNLAQILAVSRGRVLPVERHDSRKNVGFALGGRISTDKGVTGLTKNAALPTSLFSSAFFLTKGKKLSKPHSVRLLSTLLSVKTLLFYRD